MDYLKYYKDINAQKQINKLAKRFGNKKIVVYGAGLMADLLFRNYDLSKLNIVAVCDKKFGKDDKFYSYDAITPKMLKSIDFDVILVLLLQDLEIADYIKDVLIINSPNEDKPVEPFIKIPFWKCLKILLFG